jgi:hypothetical protein
VRAEVRRSWDGGAGGHDQWIIHEGFAVVVGVVGSWWSDFSG